MRMAVQYIEALYACGLLLSCDVWSGMAHLPSGRRLGLWKERERETSRLHYTFRIPSYRESFP